MRAGIGAASANRVLPMVIFALLSGATLALFSGWNKPLLYDEFVYFAAAGLPSTAAALETVWNTTTNVNQGVTGAFLMTDFWLLQLFGAQTEALRLPGLLTAGLLFGYSAVFLLRRGLSYWVLPAIPLAFGTQELVLRYVGEARTYMPLATATVGVLAYYSLSASGRHSLGGRLLGWSAVVLGVLFHPYFAVYWIAIVGFGYVTWGRSRPLREFINLPLVAFGTVTYLVIGALTWMRGKANADVDPFNFLPGPLPVEIVAQNLYFVAASPIALLGLIVVLIVPLAVQVAEGWSISQFWQASKAPLLLIAVALVLSLAISASTIINDFWIFPRQWIASTALVCLASIWLVAEWWKLSSAESTNGPAPQWRSTAVIVASIGLVVMTVPSLVDQWQRIASWGDRPTPGFDARQQLRERLDSGDVLNDAEWTSFGQMNLDVGGEVWKEFGRFYTDTDWSTFFLTDRVA